MDRAAFFSEAWKQLKKKGAEALEKSTLATKLERLADKKERPPGAPAADDLFRSLCTGCDRCMAACPVDVIMIEDLDNRYPLIYPEKDPCIHCPDTPCITSCPTGALKL